MPENIPDETALSWPSIAEAAEIIGINERRLRRRIDNAADAARTTRTIRQTVTGERPATVIEPALVDELCHEYAAKSDKYAAQFDADAANADSDNATESGKGVCNDAAGADSDAAQHGELLHYRDSERGESGAVLSQLAKHDRDIAQLQGIQSERFLQMLESITESNRALSERLEALQAAQKEVEASRAREAEKARDEAAAREERILEVAREHVKIKAQNERLQNENEALKSRKWWQWGK